MSNLIDNLDVIPRLITKIIICFVLTYLVVYVLWFFSPTSVNTKYSMTYKLFILGILLVFILYMFNVFEDPKFQKLQHDIQNMKSRL